MKKILLVFMILSLACAVGATPPKYSVAGNVITVPAGGSVQAAVTAAAAQFAATGVGVTVLDQTGGSYVAQPGVTVVYQPYSPSVPNGRICSTYIRPNVFATSSYTAAVATSLGCGSATFWPLPNAVKNLRVVYLVDSLDAAQTTSVTIKGSVIDNTTGTGVVLPLRFGGQASIVAAPGALVISDPLPIIINSAAVEVHSYATALDTQNIPSLAGKSNLAYGFPSDKMSITDFTAGTTFTDSAAMSYAFGPICLMGDSVNGNQPMVYAVGDSIIARFNSGDSTCSGLRTIMGQALNNQTVPACILGFGGWGLISVMAHPAFLSILAGNGGTIVSGYGRNGVSDWNDATHSTNPFILEMKRWWQTLNALGFTNVYQTTVTPYTKYGAGGVDTQANQVEYSSGYNAQVLAVNAWLKGEAVTSGLIKGCIDWAANVADSTANPGIYTWKPGMCTSETGNFTQNSALLHPSHLGVYNMSTSMNLAAIGLPAISSSTWFTPIPGIASPIVDARFLENYITDPIVNSGTAGTITNVSATEGYTLGGTPCKVTTMAHGKMTLAGATLADTTRMTLVAWIYPTNVSNGTSQILYDQEPAVVHWHFTGTGTFSYPLFGDCYDGGTAAVYMTANTWQMVAVTVDIPNTTIVFYKNGIAGVSKTTGMTTIAQTGTCEIGFDDGNSLDGSFGEFMIYNSVLTAPQLLQLYTQTKSRYGL